nr:DUF2059 domain-containing protein [Marinobacter santoriniensis]
MAEAATTSRQVLEASPIDDIVAQYPAMMSRGIRQGLQRNDQVPPVVANAIGQVVSSSIRAEDIEQRILDDLDRSLSAEQLQSVKDWYETPQAGKLSRAEIAASAPSAWPTIQQQAPALNKRFKGTDRAKLFDRFDRASRATESAVDTAVALQLSLASAMSALSGEPASDAQTRQRIESQRDRLKGIVGQQVYDSYLYTYQDFSNQELKLYLDFLESDAGSAFTRVVTRSIQQAITEPVDNMGAQIARFLNPALSGGQ